MKSFNGTMVAFFQAMADDNRALVDTNKGVAVINGTSVDFTQRNKTFMVRNLLHMARMIKYARSMPDRKNHS